MDKVIGSQEREHDSGVMFSTFVEANAEQKKTRKAETQRAKKVTPDLVSTSTSLISQCNCRRLKSDAREDNHISESAEACVGAVQTFYKKNIFCYEATDTL